ncbi:unnamed protein product [Arabidopsis thaliana]|uniref:Uncharacterized protein n=1 Tax=Arabidopsis thaliana TaxID=3702 RepID=A0A5S9WKF2_ARATH|nr:unnamed protein product [Arabidopsis thaliana]
MTALIELMEMVLKKLRSEHKTTMMMEFSAVRESKGKNIICPSPEMPNFVKTERNTLFKD